MIWTEFELKLLAHTTTPSFIHQCKIYNNGVVESQNNTHVYMLHLNHVMYMYACTIYMYCHVASTFMVCFNNIIMIYLMFTLQVVMKLHPCLVLTPPPEAV